PSRTSSSRSPRTRRTTMRSTTSSSRSSALAASSSPRARAGRTRPRAAAARAARARATPARGTEGNAVSLTALTPLGALLVIGLVLPLVALAGIRRRARGLRANLGVVNPRARSMLLPLGGLVVGGVLLALAASQPVFEWTSDRTVRTDAEAFVVLDVSRSMLAQSSLDEPMRIERAKAAATTLRASLPDVPVGIASLTDRVLPHLFPSVDQKVFEATLERSVGIEQPPPRSSFLTGATSLNALATLRGLRFFTPKSSARLAIVLTDGETQPV